MTVFPGPLIAYVEPASSAPTSSVPGVGISREGGFFGDEDHTVSWSTTTSSPESGYDVRVEWYVDFIFDAVNVVPQGNGSVTRVYDVASDVYAKVAYQNASGIGPYTTTSTI